jgi:hypothetical protein
MEMRRIPATRRRSSALARVRLARLIWWFEGRARSQAEAWPWRVWVRDIF